MTRIVCSIVDDSCGHTTQLLKFVCATCVACLFVMSFVIPTSELKHSRNDSLPIELLMHCLSWFDLVDMDFEANLGVGGVIFLIFAHARL
jgi:hypothetical protein